MNRVVILLDKNGDLSVVASDEPVEVYVVSESAPDDRVYLYNAKVGPRAVGALLGNSTVGHAADAKLGGHGEAALPPSRRLLS